MDHEAHVQDEIREAGPLEAFHRLLAENDQLIGSPELGNGRRIVAARSAVFTGLARVRVFISSTIRDMHSERFHLVTVVFPELRERVEQLGLEFFVVDLRWAVPTEASLEHRAPCGFASRNYGARRRFPTTQVPDRPGQPLRLAALDGKRSGLLFAKKVIIVES